MRRLVPFLAIAAVVAGCQSTAITNGGVPLDKRVSSIVSLSPSTTELASTLSLSQMLKGRTAADNYPQTISTVPVVASVKPDYEKIKEANAGLIIYDASLYNDGDIQKIKELGIDTYEIKGNTLADFEKEIYLLGARTGTESLASSYVDRIVAAANAAIGDAPNPKPKVAVVLPGSGGEHMIAGTKSFVADVVRNSGGEPVGPDADKFVPLSPESLVGQAPDTIVMGASKTDAAKEVQTILADPRLRSLPAVANKKILPIDSDVLLRRGARVDKLIETLKTGFNRK